MNLEDGARWLEAHGFEAMSNGWEWVHAEPYVSVRHTGTGWEAYDGCDDSTGWTPMHALENLAHEAGCPEFAELTEKGGAA